MQKSYTKTDKLDKGSENQKVNKNLKNYPQNGRTCLQPVCPAKNSYPGLKRTLKKQNNRKKMEQMDLNRQIINSQ